MLTTGCLLTALIGVVTSAPQSTERKLADAQSLQRQKDILDLYIGIGHNYHFVTEDKWDLKDHLGDFTDEKYSHRFMEAFNSGCLLPLNATFSMSSNQTAHQAMMLFDVLYFAKDFDTFIHMANWLKAHVNPEMYLFSLTYCLCHRQDTQDYFIPPLYEVVPNFFVPSNLLHHIIDESGSGIKVGRFDFNNSGWEFNHHSYMFGGIMNPPHNFHGEYRMSYFMEDVGLNAWFARWFTCNPNWMSPMKYNRGVRLSERRGENFYYMIQQLFARYTLERFANGLTFTNILDWGQPLEVGHNPNLIHLNGENMLPRPDNIIPSKHNHMRIKLTEAIERRIWDSIHAGSHWEVTDNSLIPMDRINGTEILGRVIYGTTDRPSHNYYRSLYYAGLDVLAYIVHTQTEQQLVGNALSSPVTALRDPIFYQYIGRLLLPFYYFKKSLGPYSKEELIFHGVTIQNVEFDRLLTYYDKFDFEVTNGVPVEKHQNYMDRRYVVRQYRLNHKPYHYKITALSENSGDAIVRVFIGPKYDGDENILTLEQARLAYFEIDRFQTKLIAGVNTIERSSTDSPIFGEDPDSFRTLIESVKNALNNKEKFYFKQDMRCKMPSRLQLPVGWKGGREYTIAVILSPLTMEEVTVDRACDGCRIYDGRQLGFPFDRPIMSHNLSHIPNIFFREVIIDYTEPSDVNRPDMDKKQH